MTIRPWSMMIWSDRQPCVGLIFIIHAMSYRQTRRMDEMWYDMKLWTVIDWSSSPSPTIMVDQSFESHSNHLLHHRPLIPLIYLEHPQLLLIFVPTTQWHSDTADRPKQPASIQRQSLILHEITSKVQQWRSNMIAWNSHVRVSNSRPKGLRAGRDMYWWWWECRHSHSTRPALNP